jgi:glycosyltransferase involved in cell wall biosynthesis
MLWGELDALGLSYYACDIDKNQENKKFWEQVHQDLRKICRDQNIGLINCNKISEVKIANLLAKEFNLKTVLTMHIEGSYAGSFLKQLDGVLAVSPHIADQVKMQNKTKKLGIKNIEWTAPFFNSEKFFNFKPTRDKKTFFKQEFDINVADAPIITMVANFLDDSKYKDHPTLLKAVAELVHVRKINIQVMLAGQGPYLEKIKGLAKQLNVSESVHFLGRTELIPELFYHSNIKVLASKSEAFGIVLLEAALMHCPLIGTSETGMENVIKHGKTGLLFKKSDVQDLANKIEKLLKDTKLQKELTDNAFDFVCENFLPEVGLKKIINFYLNVMG